MLLIHFTLRLAAMILACGGAMLGAVEPGPAFAPNLPDGHTLHLWHLNELSPPFSDRGTQPIALDGLLNGAVAGEDSWPGLGRAVSLLANAGGRPGLPDLAGAILTVHPGSVNGDPTYQPADFRYAGVDGAFTIDLILRLDVLPSQAKVVALGLASMEAETGGRIFNFRIEKEGFLAFIPLPDGGTSGGGIATLPTSGPHALAVGPWFHAAVTYDGNAGVTNNVRLYWTRLSAGLAAANQIGCGTLSEDFNGKVGHFSVGNEARTYPGNAQAEPFPGRLDEVRISGVARHPSDFFFVSAGQRLPPDRAEGLTGPPDRKGPLVLGMASLKLNGNAVAVPLPGAKGLELPRGLHRLDFEFGIQPGQGEENVQIRYQLEGIDDRWQASGRGMGLICQAVDAAGRVLSSTSFPALGRSQGWDTTLADSLLTPRREPLFIPSGTVSVRLVLSSGSPDTTGSFAMDQIQLFPPDSEGHELWKNGGFDHGENIGSPAGVPDGWRRSGTDPAIARFVECRGNPAVGLVDGDQENHGEWTATADLNRGEWDGRTLVLSWMESYNVIGGRLHQASYVNVPSGRYTFRAIGLADRGRLTGEGLVLPVTVRQPISAQPWFWPVMASGVVGLIASAAFGAQRRRTRRRLERLHLQHEIERDRTRIARDMHDDLGTRVTVLNMTASLALRELERNPDKARRHLSRMKVSARELVVAMDDLVWVVNPAHDTLDHLASHLTRLAGDMFGESPVRCRLGIPAELPPRPIRSEVRHHLAMAAKEAMHNILQHAGPCEAEVALELVEDEVRITIRDNGSGFKTDGESDGHGQGNLRSRARDIGGQCEVTSAPGKGTTIRILCPLPPVSPD